MVATGTLTSYAAVLATALTLGACSGGDPGPTQDGPAPTTVHTSSSRPTTTTSSNASTSAAPTKTEDPVLASIPKDARAETPQGAEAFVEFFMRQVNKAFTTADSTVLEGLSKPGCNMCDAFIESAADLERRHIHHKGLSIEPTSTTVQQYDDGARSVLVWTTQHSVAIVDDNGEKVDQTNAGDGVLLATLVFDSRWSVKRLQVAK